jgi:hypothetical protein
LPNFDDFVLAMIEACGLSVEDHTLQREPRTNDLGGGSRLELSQNAVSAGLCQMPDHPGLGQ